MDVCRPFEISKTNYNHLELLFNALIKSHLSLLALLSLYKPTSIAAAAAAAASNNYTISHFHCQIPIPNMCITTATTTTTIVESSVLNPNAQEWAPSPPPPPAVLLPPHKLAAAAAAFPVYFHQQQQQQQGYMIPYGMHLPPPPPPPHSYYLPTPHSPRLMNSNIPAAPPMRRSCVASFSRGDPRRRLEWRPRGCTSSSKTTLMLKNIPNQLRRDYMLEFLDSYCRNNSSLEYDFFYLPMDFSKENNLGYAFVNLTSGGGAIKLKNILNNYEWGSITTETGKYYTSKKVCEVTWATTQGKEGHVQRFVKSIFRCNKVEFLPVVFDPPRNGWNSDLSLPVTVGSVGQPTN